MHRLVLLQSLRGRGGLAKRGGVAATMLPRSLLMAAAGAARARARLVWLPQVQQQHQHQHQHQLSAAFSVGAKEELGKGEGQGSDQIRPSAAARSKNELDKKGEKFTSAEIVRKLLKCVAG
jgi:hypothetical protein